MAICLLNTSKLLKTQLHSRMRPSKADQKTEDGKKWVTVQSAEDCHGELKVHVKHLSLTQGLGTLLAERAIKATYFKIYFHESYKIFFAVIYVLIITVVHVLYDLVHVLFLIKHDL